MDEEKWIEKLVDSAFTFYLPYRDVSTYALERPLREAFKALQDSPPTTDPDTLKIMIQGITYKTFERLLEEKSERERKARIRIQEWANRKKELREKIEHFVNLFYDKVFLEICEGKVAKARRYQNQIVDGYSFITLTRLEREWANETANQEVEIK